MIKRMIRHSFKEYLPLFFTIFLAIGAPQFLISIQSELYSYGSSATEITRYADPSLLTHFILSLIVAIILPLYVFSYRYGKKQADFYSQLPLGNRTYRRFRLLTTLSYYLIAEFLSFLLAIAVLSIRQASAPAPVHENVYMVFFPYGRLVLFELLMLAFTALTYFISAFFCSLGNNLVTSAISLGVGFLALYVLIPGVALWIQAFHGDMGFLDKYPIETLAGFSPIFFMILIGSHYKAAVGRMQYSSIDEGLRITDPFCYILCIAYFLLAVGAVVYLMLRKEPSGEYSGSFGPRNRIILHFFYGSAFLIFLPNYTMGGTGALIYSVRFLNSAYLLTLAFSLLIPFYLLQCAYYRTFRLSRTNWILFAIYGGADILVTVVLSFISNATATL
jgi:hypothetical protein